LYADDLVIFVAPAGQDLLLLRAMLDTFVAASGLHTNISKCQLTPIRCTQEQISHVQELFPCQLTHFPCKYLGVPLSVHPLNNADFQPLVDSMADRLPSWKAGLMARAGRTTLAKVTPSAIPIHISIAVKVQPGALKDIDGLGWAGSGKVAGGRCLVAWSKITRPSELGDLGVLDLTTMGYALRLRWAWLSRAEPGRVWTTLPSKPEAIVQAMFDASTSVQVGSGTRALYWSDRWLDGEAILQLAPVLVQAVCSNVRKTRTVDK
jgi:hypothetical protein